MFQIKLIRSGRVIRTYKIASEQVTIGSDKSCTLKMAGDRSLMPMHATMYQEEGEITIVPESGAVVLLNGESVDFGVIEPEDVVKIGRMTFHAELVPASNSIVPQSGRQSKVPGKPQTQSPAKRSTPPQRGVAPPQSARKSEVTTQPPAGVPKAPHPDAHGARTEKRTAAGMTQVPRTTRPASPVPAPSATQKPVGSPGSYSMRQSRTEPVHDSTQLMIQEEKPPKASIPVTTKPHQPPPSREPMPQMPESSEQDLIPVPQDSPPLMSFDEDILGVTVNFDEKELASQVAMAASGTGQTPATTAGASTGLSDANSALNADDYFFDDSDDPSQDEFFFDEPFDLTEALSGDRRTETNEKPAGKLASYCAADVVRTSNQRVADTEYVHPGRKYRSNLDDLQCVCRGKYVELRADPRLLSSLHKGGEAVDIRSLPTRKGKVAVALSNGDRALLTGIGGTYVIDAYNPPAAPLKSAFGFNSSALALIAGAIVLHATFAIAAWVIMPDSKSVEEKKEEEIYAVVEMEKPEFKKDEAKKPEPKPVEKDATAMAERAPQVSRRHVKKIRERATKAKTSDAVGSLMNILSKGSGKEGKTDKLKDLVSNIDAVGAGKGTAAYNIAGAIGSLPGGDVNVAREGGGGILSTLSGEQVAGKGSNVGTLARKKGSGKIRGKVTKMSSSARVKGSLSKADVSRVVNSHIHAVQACYEKALLRSPGLSGRIVFDWTVKENGRVSNVRVRSSTLGNSSVSQCISSKIKKWKFPRPKGGEVVITYPFLFRSVSS